MPVPAAFERDANGIPITYGGLTTSNSKNLIANNTTAAVPIFQVNGSVLVTGIWGVVTTALGNCTATYWRLNDQTAQVNITLNTGTSLTSAVAGGLIVKKGLAAAVLVFNDASAGRISEPTTLETFYFSPFAAIQKTGGIATNIEFVYTTTDTPTSGAITFSISWVPLSSGSTITTL